MLKPLSAPDTAPAPMPAPCDGALALRARAAVKGQMIFGMRFFLIAIHPLVYAHAARYAE